MSIDSIHFQSTPTLDLGTSVPKPTTLSEGQMETTRELWSADSMTVGVWECSPGKFTGFRNGYHEVCHILSGVALVAVEGEPPVEVRAGDTLIMPAGWQGIWEVSETIRKTYVTLHGISSRPKPWDLTPGPGQGNRRCTSGTPTKCNLTGLLSSYIQTRSHERDMSCLVSGK
jgi:uncharacterized cupin superfamily protein